MCYKKKTRRRRNSGPRPRCSQDDKVHRTIEHANKDRLSNFSRTAELVGQTSGQSCLSAIGTKIARLEQLFASGKPPENESVIDSIIDLANYSFLLYCIIIDK